MRSVTETPPPIVYVMIQPGTSLRKGLRSVEYDTVSTGTPVFDGGSASGSPKEVQTPPRRLQPRDRWLVSGGICAFNVAWLQPDKFARVHSTVGSFTSIQWRPQEKLEGGNVYPFKVRKEPKRNIRVWMSDGSDDLENNHGSWPMQNIQMANY